MNDNILKVAIIGSGPAGLTAAIYASRANLKPVLFEGMVPGGQLTITTEVDNYPGFPEGIIGPSLMENMKIQAKRFGTEFVLGNVKKIDFSKNPYLIYAGEKEYQAMSIIIATGASARFLGLASEKRFMGRGVSACATCDGFFFKDKEIVVVGGGDTAIEEALFLTKFASRVHVIHRRDTLRATMIMRDKANANKKIAFIWDTVVEDILGTDKDGVTGVRLKNIKTNNVQDMQCNGVFIAIGHVPNTEIFKGSLDMDNNGYLVTDRNTRTNIKGVFAAGDVQDARYKQAVSAAGTGCMAAIEAERFLES